MNSNFQFDRTKVKDNPEKILNYLEKLSSEVEKLRTSKSEQQTRISELGQKNNEQKSYDIRSGTRSKTNGRLSVRKRL